jgi:hypothetical protein
VGGAKHESRAPMESTTQRAWSRKECAAERERARSAAWARPTSNLTPENGIDGKALLPLRRPRSVRTRRPPAGGDFGAVNFAAAERRRARARFLAAVGAGRLGC